MLISQPSTGDGLISHDDVHGAGGGTFDYLFASGILVYEVRFRGVGIFNSHIISLRGEASMSGLWAHIPGLNDAHTALLAAGNFFAGVAPNPGEAVPFFLGSDSLILELEPAQAPPDVPEPGTLSLLAFGVAALAAIRRGSDSRRR
jgi:hypothetical protein